MTELAKLYGESLYDLAAEETLEVRILEELDGAALISYPLDDVWQVRLQN